jgi:DNA (cytosine-5)-methyltransferase 1
VKPCIVSLFTGAGGIDIGFESAGFKTVFATDIWRLACETFKLNHPDCEVQVASIPDVSFEPLKQKYQRIVGVVGGPPCPAFSKSRFYRKEKQRGLEDELGMLTVSNYFRAVAELEPEFFFFENVHGFVYKPHKSALEYVKEASETLGYEIQFDVVNAADYGVPQTRERFICIGVKRGRRKFVWPEPTHSEPNKADLMSQPWVPVGAVLSDLDVALPGDEKMVAGSRHKDLLELVPPGDNYLYFTKERGYPDPKFKWRSRYWSFLLKLSPDRPSWTIQASHSNNMGPFHWRNRFLRIPEIKRIQSFPDSYEILGNYRDQWRQVGNAVPPLLAGAFARAIYKQYF